MQIFGLPPFSSYKPTLRQQLNGEKKKKKKKIEEKKMLDTYLLLVD